jgi:hypothetical protein
MMTAAIAHASPRNMPMVQMTWYKWSTLGVRNAPGEWPERAKVPDLKTSGQLDGNIFGDCVAEGVSAIWSGECGTRGKSDVLDVVGRGCGRAAEAVGEHVSALNQL